MSAETQAPDLDAAAYVCTRTPDRVPAFVVDAIVAYRNACYRPNGDAVSHARIVLERAILSALTAAFDGGETQRRARLRADVPTDDDLLAWLEETAEAGDNMADTYRESAAAGSERHADDVAYWEREARCARGLQERLRAARGAA